MNLARLYMIKAFAVFVLSVLGVGNILAQDHALVSGGESRDKKYQVVVLKPSEAEFPADLSVKSVKIGEEIGGVGGAYACFGAAKEPENTLALWSPDSKYVAIKWCEGKRDRDVLLAQVTDKKATWITLDDYMAQILHELKVDSINRYENNTPSRWLSDSELVIDVLGDCIIGGSDNGTWKEFHYEVCVDVSTGKVKWIKQLEVKNEEG